MDKQGPPRGAVTRACKAIEADLQVFPVNPADIRIHLNQLIDKASRLSAIDHAVLAELEREGDAEAYQEK